ncbi:hypothetical protein BC828DRAFT_379688 [Blastocladiella britannica]|nr:hypothetical protein BC828DRAFT_379688 [Blastocladiella britannica]
MKLGNSLFLVVTVTFTFLGLLPNSCHAMLISSESFVLGTLERLAQLGAFAFAKSGGRITLNIQSMRTSDSLVVMAVRLAKS